MSLTMKQIVFLSVYSDGEHEFIVIKDRLQLISPHTLRVVTSCTATSLLNLHASIHDFSPEHITTVVFSLTVSINTCMCLRLVRECETTYGKIGIRKDVERYIFI